MKGTHVYSATVRWTGNRGQGTTGYTAYDRTHVIRIDGKPAITGSADPSFRGDPGCWNPEDMLLGSVSACHMLWFLHLAMEAGWVVEAYEDAAEAVMEMNPDGSGQFTGAVLHPAVRISAGDPALSAALHHKAHQKYFIARSVNFPVACEPTVQTL